MRVNKKIRKKVLVAMSGGVDSSVAAAILKNQGYEVAGIFMRLWPESDNAKEKEAKKVAEIIGIPFFVKNLEKEFKKEVVEYFLRELKFGRTPNPCVMCNKCIKFEKLFETMFEMKFDFIATGHYARIMQENTNYKEQNTNKPQNTKIKFHLYEARDKNKDQSYFLYNLTQKRLSKILFPLGNYTKTQVRKLAKKFNLPVYDKPESQDICFIDEKNPEEFIKKHLKTMMGNIIDPEGKVIGRHKGLQFYTIGQRKGLNIGGNGPYFVIEKDMKNNQLIVTNDTRELSLFKKELKIKEASWTGKMPGEKLKAQVKIRYRTPKVDAIIKAQNEKQKTKHNIYTIKFSKPQIAVTPGQSAVIYSNEGEVTGGGVII